MLRKQKFINDLSNKYNINKKMLYNLKENLEYIIYNFDVNEKEISDLCLLHNIFLSKDVENFEFEGYLKNKINYESIEVYFKFKKYKRL